MSVTVGRAKLNNATKELMAKWEDTRSVWTDSRAQVFERDVIDEITPRVRAAVSAMERLASQLHQAQRECS